MNINQFAILQDQSCCLLEGNLINENCYCAKNSFYISQYNDLRKNSTWIVGQHRVLRHRLDGQGEGGAGPWDPGGEGDEGVVVHDGDGFGHQLVELGGAVPVYVVDLGLLLALGHGLLSPGHHINVVEVNVFKAPAKIFLVSQKYFIEVSHPSNKDAKVDVKLVKPSRKCCPEIVYYFTFWGFSLEIFLTKTLKLLNWFMKCTFFCVKMFCC